MSLTVSNMADVPSPLIVQDVKGYNSWPFVQTLGGGLVCAYSRGERHSIDERTRGVYARLSMDGGKTWAAESTVVNTPDYGESAIGKGLDENGAMLLWVRYVGADWKHDLYRSADGVNFEKIASLRPDPMPMQITDVIHVPTVGLMCFWFAGRYRDLPENAWGTLVSADNGKTWKQNVMEANLPKADWPTEQCGIYLGDGRIIAITRCEVCDDCPQRRQFQLQSTDFGKTWTKMRTNIGDVKISTPSLIYDASTGLLYNYYYHRGKGFLKRRVAPLEKIWDHPLDWPDFELVATGSANDHHAGNVNVIADGDIHYCAYYSGDENNTAVVLFAAQGTKGT